MLVHHVGWQSLYLRAHFDERRIAMASSAQVYILVHGTPSLSDKGH